MAQDFERIDYPVMIDEAMRGAVKKVLQQVVEHGLPGKHHFFISFDTTHPGVRISPQLKGRFPEEMTIVVQYQYWDLEVHQTCFSLMLSFNNIPERLVIPFDALTAFADPSIKFGLQFHTRPVAGSTYSQDNFTAETGVETSFDQAMPDVGNQEEVTPSSAEVISIDAFRKK